MNEGTWPRNMFSAHPERLWGESPKWSFENAAWACHNRYYDRRNDSQTALNHPKLPAGNSVIMTSNQDIIHDVKKINLIWVDLLYFLCSNILVKMRASEIVKKNHGHCRAAKSLCHEGRRTAFVQYFLDDVNFYISLQSSTKLPNCTADTSLLHFPALQHLVHHLWQAVTVVVVLYGFYFHTTQAQAACTRFPMDPNVVPQQI